MKKASKKWQKITVIVMIFAVVMNFLWAQKNFAHQENIDQLNTKKHVFLSDLKYDKEKSKAGWNILLYDKNVNKNKISLNVNGEREFFKKGVFAHADSLVAYNIEGMKFGRVQGYFGVDAEAGAETDGVKLLIYADDVTKNLVENDPKLAETVKFGQSVFFNVRIPAGTKYLYIGADKAGHNKSDWAAFGGVKLVKNDYVAPRIDGVESLAKLDEKLMGYATAKEAIEGAEFDVLKREFVRKAGYRQLIEMMETSEEKRVAIEWLMADVKNLRGFLMSGEPNSNYDDAMQVLGRLLLKHEGDLTDNTAILRGTRGDLYRRMMMSLATAHSRQACFWLDWSQCSDAVERYELYKEMHADGLLRNDIFETIEAEEMRWIMEGMLTNKELKWLNFYARVKRLNKKAGDLTAEDRQKLKGVEPHLDPYMYIRYTFDYKYDADKYYTGDGVEWKKKYGFDEFGIDYGMEKVGEKDLKRRKLWMVFEEGAVCGGISKTGTNLWTAFGMPASVNGQPGHAAYLQYGVQKEYRAENGEDYRAGIWWLGNNISGWVESEKGERLLAGWGYNQDRRNKEELGAFNVSYMMLAQNNINRYADYVKAREMAMLAEVYSNANISGSPMGSGRIANVQKVEETKNGDIVRAQGIYNELLNVAPRDLEGWRGLVISYLKDRSKGERDYVKLAERLAEGLKEYPLPMADLINVLEEATKDAGLKSMIRQSRNVALEKMTKNVPRRKDFLQPDAARDMANRILGRQEKMVKFSFDGKNAGSIVLGSKYAGGGVRYEYSIDGKKTWKETSEVVHKLTEEELAQLTEENDILVHFVGDGGKFGEGGGLDANNAEHLKRAIVIDIKKHGAPKVSANDLENNVIGDTNELEWREFGENEWKELAESTRFEGDREIVVRKKSRGEWLYSDEVALSFKKNEENKENQYISTGRIKIKSASSEQADRNNKKEYAMDGNPNTFWHSAWNGSDKKREIVLELDKVAKLKAFEYLPRQDVSGGNGTVLTGEILVSEDGVNFKSVAKEKWAGNASLKRVDFAEPVKAKFVKFVGVETVGGYISAAMLNLYEDANEEKPESPVKPKDPEVKKPDTPVKPEKPSETGKTNNSGSLTGNREPEGEEKDAVDKDINSGRVSEKEVESRANEGGVSMDDVPTVPNTNASAKAGSVGVVVGRQKNGNNTAGKKTEKNEVNSDEKLENEDAKNKNEEKNNESKKQSVGTGIIVVVASGIIAGVGSWFVLKRRKMED